MRTAPDDWQQISAEFRATGRYYELSADVTDSDGSHHAWTASHDIAMHFAKLRAGMYREGRGTWFNARYQIEKPSSYNLEFDRQEPTWRTPPPPAAFRDELHFFPRTEDNVPEWLMRKLSGLPPERPGRRFRLARIFDGTAPNGRPSVNRPQISDDDRDRLLEYLDHSALALPERGHDVDRLSADGRPTVPVAFHTDGVWVWPAAVNYYLRRYGVPPDPDLVSHARGNGFRPPEVDEATRVAAAATITGGRPPGAPPRPGGPNGPAGPASPNGLPSGPNGPGVPAGPAGPGGLGAPGGPGGLGGPNGPGGLGGPGRQGPPNQPVGVPAPAMAGQGGPGITDLSSGQTTALAAPAAAAVAPPQPPPPAPIAAPEENTGGGAHSVADEPEPIDRVESVEPVDEPAPPVAAPPIRSGSQQERTLNLLNQRLSELRVPEHTYRIGEPAAQTWYLEQVDEGWQVGWFDGEFSSPMLFEEVADASAFLLGKLLLGVPAESALHDNVAPAAVPPHHVAPQDERIDAQQIDAPRINDIEPPTDEDTQQREPARELAPNVPEHMVDPMDSGDRLLHADDDHQIDDDRDRSDRDVPEPVDVDLPAHGVEPNVDLHAEPHVDPLADLQGDNRANGRAAMPQQSPAQMSPQLPPPLPPQPQVQQQVPLQSPPPGVPQGAPQSQPPAEWPIQPMSGEPPLTLFRGKRLLELQPGTEVDRFGSPEGNLTYVAGTPFEQRSLVPDWVHRPYHMYRVIRPVQALTGGAIPWFDQPGGGTAYLLPRTVEELVGAGDIVEIEPAEPPVS
jgi:hypothetical protein